MMPEKIETSTREIVGSVRCVYATAPCLRLEFVRRSPFVVLKFVLLIVALRRVVAVSYTYFRAHETVLESVCRLLPEKSKC